MTNTGRYIPFSGGSGGSGTVTVSSSSTAQSGLTTPYNYSCLVPKSEEDEFFVKLGGKAINANVHCLKIEAHTKQANIVVELIDDEEILSPHTIIDDLLNYKLVFEKFELYITKVISATCESDDFGTWELTIEFSNK